MIALTFLFLTLVLGVCVAAQGQATDSVSSDTAAYSPIPYATVQVIAPGDSEAIIVEKAAKVLPRPNQTTWMRLEKTFFNPMCNF